MTRGLRGASILALVVVLTGECELSFADNGRSDGNVLTYVCRVQTTFAGKSGQPFVSTSCIDGKYSCNDDPQTGYCAPLKNKAQVSRTCDWVGLSQCHSQ